MLGRYRARGAGDSAYNDGCHRQNLCCNGCTIASRQTSGASIYSDKMVKRCGLDYWYLVDIRVYENLDDYFEKNGDSRLYLATTKAPQYVYTEADFFG